MKILIIKNRALGDAVLGLSSVSYLKGLFPEASITYGVPSWVNPLFFDLKTDADEIIPLDFDTMGNWYKSYQKIKKGKFDRIIELNQSGRTKKFFNIFKIFSPFSNYFAHNHNTSRGEVLDQGKKKANIQRDLDACWSAFKKGDPPQFLDHPPKAFSSVEIPKEDAIILGVVATRESKMWPLKYYVELMNTLIEQRGPNIKFIIPLSQQYKDRKIEQELIELGIPNQAQFIKVSLTDLPKHLLKGKLYIGNDTGIKHICASLGIKTFTVFGVEDPLEWHPYNREHKYLAANVPSDAYKNPDKFKNCLEDIKPEKVVNRISF